MRRCRLWVKSGAVAPVSDGPGHSLRADVLARLDFRDLGALSRSSRRPLGQADGNML
jgi:hypothetical protein